MRQFHAHKQAYNVAMRHWLPKPVLLGVICLLTLQPTHSQQTSLSPSSSLSSDQPGPDISVFEVAFSGAFQMPVADQEHIADSLKHLTYSGSPDGVVDEAEERVRAAWQNRGYFKVQVSGDAKILTASVVNQQIALSFRVDEGQQYRLGEIRFLHNKAITNVGTLRAMFSIADGDVFSREKIADGLENLRKAYGEIGYINFTCVPDAKANDEERLIDLEIDVDEGKQFRIGSISFPGLDETAQREALRDFPLRQGQVYNQRVWKLFLERHNSLPDSCSSDHRIDEKAGTITLSLDCGQHVE